MHEKSMRPAPGEHASTVPRFFRTSIVRDFVLVTPTRFRVDVKRFDILRPCCEGQPNAVGGIMRAFWERARSQDPNVFSQCGNDARLRTWAASDCGWPRRAGRSTSTSVRHRSLRTLTA